MSRHVANLTGNCPVSGRHFEHWNPTTGVGHSANTEQSPNTVKGKEDADGMSDVTMWENRLRLRNSSSRTT